MKTSPRLALVATGQLRHYPVIRLGSVADQLGPVKAPSFRQASRIANTLRAGYPVHRYEDLGPSRLILVCAPPRRLPLLVEEMAAASFPWGRKTVLASGGSFDSGSLDDLKKRGAEVGSLHPIAGPQEQRYFVEGDRPAVRAAKKLVEGGGGRVIEIRRGAAPVCEAGEAFVSWLLVALIDASSSCLRKAGLTAGRAGPIVEWAALRTLRSYAKAGRRAFRGPTTAEERQTFVRMVESLRRFDPALAAYLVDTARLVSGRMGHEPAWIDECAPPRSRAACPAL